MMDATTPTQLPFDWTPPEGITFAAEWCPDMRSWRVTLRGYSHAETIYVPDERISPAALDALADRFVEQSDTFAGTELAGGKGSRGRGRKKG